MNSSEKIPSCGTDKKMRSPQMGPEHHYDLSVNRFNGKRSYTDIMVQRFRKLIVDNPAVDQIDLLNENFYLNGGKLVEHESQSFPEYSQQRYLRMRLAEESFALYNYLDPALNPKFDSFLKIKKNLDQSKIVKSIERSYGIQKLYDLHQKKKYRIETLFVAANVFDRYLALVGHWNVSFQKLVHLATISMLIGAKLE